MIEKLTGDTRSKTLRAIDAKALELVREDWRTGARSTRFRDDPEPRTGFLWRRLGRVGAAAFR